MISNEVASCPSCPPHSPWTGSGSPPSSAASLTPRSAASLMCSPSLSGTPGSLLWSKSKGNYPGHKWRRNLLPGQFSPVEVLQPLMFLQLLNAVETKTRLLVSLQQFVDKVHRLKAPAHRQLLLRYLGLVSQYFVPDFLPGIAHVRSLSKRGVTEPIIIS